MAENNKIPMSSGKKMALGCGGLVVIVVICSVIASVIGLFGVSEVVTSVATSIEDSAKEKSKAEDDLWNNPSKMNESVDVKGVAWTIISAKNMGSKIKATSKYGDDCLANSGKFIYVQIKIKNNTNKMQSTIGTSIYDSKKRKFENSSEVYGCVDNELSILDSMNPGIEKTFVQVFEVPKDASGFKIEATDLDFLNNAHKYIDLGI